MSSSELARRWRLILGRYAEGSLAASVLGEGDANIDQVLSYLFDRDYVERGHRHQTGQGQGGSLDPSALTAITWLEQTRDIFPQSTFERLQTQAIEQYGMTEILADAKAAESLQPSPELGTALLRVRGNLDSKLEAGLRAVIAKVVEEIVRLIKPKFTAALSGSRNRFRRSFQPRAQNFDWRSTIRANLANWDSKNQRLIIEDVRFNSRLRRKLPWDVILCVDQSGSMASSVLYSAICASILAGLPGINVSLILFDTSVVDMSSQVGDPVGVLMTAQLGGGTNIAGALGYSETLVRHPKQTVLALISDFEEGGSVSELLQTVLRLRAAGVTLLGIAALDEEASPQYDPRVAGLLADRGMQIAALTPEHFAAWLAEVMA
ncbi:MAG: VWA domain-containing protein [Coriobacteriia bacterium]|nr:VWA domain-containing protein [Coriobacteriia bacterium]MCL2750227.1 VWA domain-containing protein [Coriobacteriia bacterium]